MYGEKRRGKGGEAAAVVRVRKLEEFSTLSIVAARGKGRGVFLFKAALQPLFMLSLSPYRFFVFIERWRT